MTRSFIRSIATLALVIAAPVLAAAQDTYYCFSQTYATLQLDPAFVLSGEPTTLRWTVTAPPECASLSAELNEQYVPRSGSRLLFPTLSTSYRIRARLYGMTSPTLRIATLTVVRPRRTDILWRRSTTGQELIWVMRDTTQVGSSFPALVDPAWTVVGTADFTRNGEADILWRDQLGRLHIGVMRNANVLTVLHPVAPGPTVTSRVAGVGDFNGDGHADILWRHANGQLQIWLLHYGQFAASTVPAPNPGANWSVQGAGDFDGDRTSDILWRHTNGQLSIWFMAAGGRISQTFPGGQNPTLGWTVQGIGDFNGDLQADVLWRDGIGQLAIWFRGEPSGAAYPSYQNVPGPVDLAWQIKGVADFDDDSFADILWKRADGWMAIWRMHGGQFLGEASLHSFDSTWEIAGLLPNRVPTSRPFPLPPLPGPADGAR